MAKRPDGYFAFKLIAPSIAQHPTLFATATITAPMGAAQALRASTETTSAPTGFSIADDDSHVLHGIAGHLVGTILNFSAPEVARCKSQFEAEQLVKSKYKSWLADAYDWFVFPGYLRGTAAGKAATARTTATQRVVSKKIPGARKPATPRGKK